jgi:hypothetical protein
MRELMNDDSELLARCITIGQGPEASSDYGTQNVLRRALLVKRASNSFHMRTPHGLLQNLGIQSQFVPKMIVNKRDVRTSPRADLAHGCGVVTEIRKYLCRHFEQFSARVVQFSLPGSPCLYVFRVYAGRGRH